MNLFILWLLTTLHLSAQETAFLSLMDILRISVTVLINPSLSCKHAIAFLARTAQLPASLSNGDGEIRTLDPLLARQVLSQLSYTPIR